MPRHEPPRPPLLPLARPRPRRWRHHRATTALLVFSALTLAACAWLALIFSPAGPKCWHAIHDWQGGPVAFPWEPLLTADDEPSPPSLPPPPRRIWPAHSTGNPPSSLALHNLAFGIAGSAQLWPRRKEYVKLWWRPDEMIGFVWLEENVTITEQGDAEHLPQVMISEDVSGFRYTHSTGHPSGVRLARIIQEMFKLDLPDVQWFVLGDDDTIFSPDNLLRVLKKYDSREMYYIGNPSESHSSNNYFSHNMAFGGGGIAISYPLAQTLSKMLDECLERYPFLFGSDDRLHACITELGVPLTKEPGFHQFDVHGNPFGLLSAHPTAPFLSIHHLDEVDPVFPKFDVLGAMQHLTKAMRTEPSSFLQQCICYNRAQKLSISISLGYAVQVYPYILLPRDLQRPEITFKAWNSRDSGTDFDVDTRRSLRSICNRPFVFFLEDIVMGENEVVVSRYKRDTSIDERKRRSFCFSRVLPPEEVEHVQVSAKPLNDHWFSVPRRQCCRLLDVKNKVLEITVAPCQQANGSKR